MTLLPCSVSTSDRVNVIVHDAFIYGEIQRNHADRKIPMIQLMRTEALAAFHAWREKNDKIHY